jgi:hypothetical protein
MGLQARLWTEMRVIVYIKQIKPRFVNLNVTNLKVIQHFADFIFNDDSFRRPGAVGSDSQKSCSKLHTWPHTILTFLSTT